MAGLPALMHCGDGDLPCTAHNLSRSGTLLVGDLPTPADPAIAVTLSSASGDVSLRIEARVARVTRDGDPPKTLLGLEFRSLNPEQTETLDILVSRVVEGVAPAPLMQLGPEATPEEVRAALDLIPLAHRITLAARAKPREREYLMLDGSPQVLDAVARNPGITLPEIKALARIGELLPTTLETMLKDRRWEKDEELKILVATHPRATMAIAERVVAGLGEPGLRRLIQKPGLHPAVRTKLLGRLSEGRRKTW